MPVEFSGPLFDGTAQRQLETGADTAEQAIADAVRDQVRLELRRRARVRTGYYENRVRVESARGDRVVTDSGVIYADWLEGDAPRNRRSTFKGHRHTQAAWRQIEPRAGAIAEQALGPFIEKMR